VDGFRDPRLPEDPRPVHALRVSHVGPDVAYYRGNPMQAECGCLVRVWLNVSWTR
jgi:hypothetical protein